MCPNNIKDNQHAAHVLASNSKAGTFESLLSLIKPMLLSTFLILLIELIACQPSSVKTAEVDALAELQESAQSIEVNISKAAHGQGV